MTLEERVPIEDRCCGNCYYEVFDMKCYPCSRCIRNMPTEDMWRLSIFKAKEVEQKLEREGE